jgi:hypothetical protein
MSHYHRWAARAGFMVTVHLEGEVPAGDFKTYVQAHRDQSIRAELVYAAGDAALTPSQRHEITAYGDSMPEYRIAALISSRLPRGIATAISWFIKGLKVLPPTEIDTACEFLGMSTRDREWAKATIKELIERR